MFLRGSNIRFVHIPDNLDITRAVEDRVSFRSDDILGAFCLWWPLLIGSTCALAKQS